MSPCNILLLIPITILIRALRLRLRFLRNSAVNSQKTQAEADTSDKYEIREHKVLRSKFTKNAGGGGHLLQESNNIREGVTQ